MVLSNETGTRFIDVNADGKADIVQGSYSTTTGATANGLYLNNYIITPLHMDGTLLHHGTA
jgi:hypothetical protein